jgi:cell division protein FtsB
MAARTPAQPGGVQPLSAGELKQRVAVIKRFKELLKSQRDRFSAYLDALDKQKSVIESGTADDLLRHVELEEKIVADIFSIQKVIDPLEKMYQSAKSEDEITGLKEALEGLKTEAVVRSEQNRELLSKRMTELRSEIKNLRSNPYIRRTENTTAPTHIDIRG